MQRLGRRAYGDVHALQRELQAGRKDSGEDRLLVVEHEPVLTLGRAHPEPKLRVAAPAVEAAGIAVVQTERGGDITYHGPGQLVAYPIIDLRTWGVGATDLVTGLEEAVIRVVAMWEIEASRDARNRGVWTGGRKIASTGINVRRGVSMHGVALNVDPDMGHFELINPCGLGDVEMTSMTRELGQPVALGEVEDAFVEMFAAVFGCTLREAAG